MLDYTEIDWMDLLSLLMSDLVFRAGREGAAPQDAQRWRGIFTKLKTDVKWGKQEEDEAWKEMLRRVRLCAARVVPEDVREEVIQKVLVKLLSLQTLERVAAAGSVAGYLAVALRNTFSDMYRHRSRGKEVSLLDVFIQQDISGDTGPSQNDPLVSVLRKEVRALPEKDRDLLRLRFWKELTIAEIAEKQGERYSTVAVRLFRLLKKLRTSVKLE